eukprot:COSAG05_NODE_2312_length_3243_cov_2.859097_1_plen_75_part_00
MQVLITACRPYLCTVWYVLQAHDDHHPAPVLPLSGTCRYGALAQRLNDWENHRTQTEYEDAPILKFPPPHSWLE